MKPARASRCHLRLRLSEKEIHIDPTGGQCSFSSGPSGVRVYGVWGLGILGYNPGKQDP